MLSIRMEYYRLGDMASGRSISGRASRRLNLLQFKAHMNSKQTKDFLADQATQQADHDGAPLSDLEKRMMYFTESDPASCDDPISLNDEFEGKYDNAEYEAKMSRLLTHRPAIGRTIREARW